MAMRGTNKGLLLGALVVVVWLIAPFGLVVAGIWALVVFARRQARRIEARPGGGVGLRYNLFSFGVLYLVPAGLAVTFYFLLSLYVRFFGDSLSTGWLISLQRFFQAVSRFFSDYLKLNEVAVFGLLLAVHLVTYVLLARRAEGGLRLRTASALNRGAEFYTRYSGPVASGLVALSAFTFFGMQPGAPTEDLELRIRWAQQGYADAAKKIEAELSQRVAGELHDKVQAAFPQPYRDALAGQRDLGRAVDALATRAANAKAGYTVTVPEAERVLSDETAKRMQVDRLPTKVRVGATGPVELPAELTPKQIAAVESAAADLPRGSDVDLVDDGRKKVALQTEKIVSERIVALAKPLTDAVPIVEPVLQAFAETFDKTLQERIGKAYDRLMALAARNPGDLTAAVDREAKAVVAQTDITKPVERATPRAQQLADAFVLRMSALRSAPTLIDQGVTDTLAARQKANTRTVEPGTTRSPFELNKLPLIEVPKLPRLPLNPGSYRFPYDYNGTHPYPNYEPPTRYRIPPQLNLPKVAPPRPPVRARPIFVW
ncbi:MAG: hypothetical protein ABIQ18_30845 [Umezawaea sp.]